MLQVRACQRTGILRRYPNDDLHADVHALGDRLPPRDHLALVEAEAEGLDKIFLEAGFEWREPGCSMCLGMNPDRLAPGERCASTSNRRPDHEE